MTPNSPPSDKDDLSVSTSWTCLVSSDFAIVPLIDARGCPGWANADTGGQPWNRAGIRSGMSDAPPDAVGQCILQIS